LISTLVDIIGEKQTLTIILEEAVLALKKSFRKTIMDKTLTHALFYSTLY